MSPFLCLFTLIVACGADPDETTPRPDCDSSELLTDDQFVGGLVLAEGTCWRVDSPLSLSDGTVTIESGVEIVFGPDVPVRIGAGGQLRIDGTEEAPVFLTTGDPLIGWQGVLFEGSQGSDNAWSWAFVENAGSANWSGAPWSAGAVYLQPSSTLSMDHVTLRNSAAHGLIAAGESSLTASDLTFEGNAIPAYFHPNVASALGAETVFTDNENPHVRVVFGNSDTVATDQTWAALSVPWRVEDRFFVEAELSFEPGASVEFTSNSSLRVTGEGRLVAPGTAEAPIVFRGTDAQRGFWQGISIDSLGGAGGIALDLDHVEIADAGSDQWSGRADTFTALWLESPSSAAITNTTIRRHQGFALWASDEARLEMFADNRITEGDDGIFLHPDRAGELSGTTEIDGNDLDRVHLVFGNSDRVSVDATWPDLGVPYLVEDRFFVAADLALDPGVVLEATGNLRIVVVDDGRIDANGTSDQPVIFRGVSEAADGFWLGIELEGAEPSTFTNAVLRDTGSGTFTGDPESDAAFYLNANSDLTLDQVDIGPGGGYGVHVADDSATLTCSGVTFTGLADGAVYDDDSDTVSPGC